jgi:hypothetical protein
LVWGGREERRDVPDLFEISLVTMTFALMLWRFRMVPAFIITAAPFTARRLWPRLRARRWLPAAVLTTGLLTPLAMALRGETPWGLGFDQSHLPIEAARFIAAQGPQGPVYNPLGFGGYLIWSLHPEVRVFIDGRTAYLYPPDFLRRAWEAESDAPAFAELASRYGFQWAVVDAREGVVSGRPIAADGDWAMIYLDDTAAVYVNVTGPNRSLMWSGYQVLRHLSPWPEMLQAALPTEALEHDSRLALAQAPGSVRAHYWAAAAALRRGDARLARVHRDRIAELSPRDIGLPFLDRFLVGGPQPR